MVKNVALYLRKSRGDSEKDLIKHEKQLIDLCNENGYGYTIYNDAIITGDSFHERESLQSMLNNINKYDAVVCTEISRLARKNEYLQVIGNILADNDVKVVTLQTTYNLRLISDKAMFGIGAVFAEIEKMQTLQRLMNGRIEKAKKGEYIGGPAPYGYSVDRSTTGIHKLVINPAEAEVIKEIFKLHESGHGQGGIAKSLNSRGIKTQKGNQWRQSNIHPILENSLYMGTAKHDMMTPEGDPIEVVVDNAHEAIISKEQFYRTVQIRKERLEANGGTTGKQERSKGRVSSILKDLIRCDSCGNKLRINARKTRKVSFVEKCRNPECKSPTVGLTEPLVVEYFWEKFDAFRLHYYEKFDVLNSQSVENHTDNYKQQLNQLLKQEDKLLTRNDNLVDAYSDGDFTRAEYERAKGRIKIESEKLQSDIKIVRSKLEEAEGHNSLEDIQTKIGLIEEVSKNKSELNQTKLEEVNRALKLLLSSVAFGKRKVINQETQMLEDEINIDLIPIGGFDKDVLDVLEFIDN